MEGRTLLTIFLIAVGAILLAGGNRLVASVADTDPPVIADGATFNYGTWAGLEEPYATWMSLDVNQPGVVEPGRSGFFDILVLEWNPAGAKITVNGIEYTLDVYSVSNNAVRYYKYWTTPSSLDTLITVVVYAWDTAGNSATKTFYLKTASIEGYFEINGKKVTGRDDVIYVNSRTLNIRFVATRYGSLIGSVEVQGYSTSFGGYDIPKTALSVESAGQSWSLTLTVPQDGAYKIYGYLHSTSGGEWRKMAIDVAVNVTPGFTLDSAQMLGLASLLVGLVNLIWTRRVMS